MDYAGLLLSCRCTWPGDKTGYPGVAFTIRISLTRCCLYRGEGRRLASRRPSPLFRTAATWLARRSCTDEILDRYIRRAEWGGIVAEAVADNHVRFSSEP